MSLKDRFEEIIHLKWDEFVALEKDKNISVDEGVLCSLVRLCADTDEIAAAKLSFDRIDGLLETPVEVRVPKFYIRYVNAESLESSTDKQLKTGEDIVEEKDKGYDPATAKLRETLKEMREMPSAIIPAILKVKNALDENKKVENKIPQVKHVMVANLLRNIGRGRFRAIELVFDQLDGKLTRVINLLGGQDVYIDDYLTTTAPAGSIKDDNGYYIAENQLMTTAWLRGFANSQKGLEILAEGLEDGDRG